MTRFIVSGLSCLAAAAFTGCTSNDKLTMGGVPAWLASGAKIDSEPKPMAPDPAILPLEEESGPVEWKLITDKRRYPAAPTKKVEKTTAFSTDPLERGRSYRLRRLVR